MLSTVFDEGLLLLLYFVLGFFFLNSRSSFSSPFRCLAAASNLIFSLCVGTPEDVIAFDRQQLPDEKEGERWPD